MQAFIDEEKLISLVEKNYCIYNKFSGGYKLAIVKDAKWKEISQELGAPEEQCRRWWTSLRERYGRMCRRLDVPSGSGASSVEHWPHFEAMHFLREHVKPRRTRCNTNICNDLKLSPSQNLTDSWVSSQSTYSSSSSLSSPHLLSQPPKPPSPLPATLTSSRSPSPLLASNPQQQAFPNLENYVLKTSPTPSPTNSGNIRKPGKQKRKSGSLENFDHDFQEVMGAFKKVCKARESRKGNDAVQGFGQMICATISEMSAEKQFRTMQRVTEIVIEIKLEPESEMIAFGN